MALNRLLTAGQVHSIAQNVVYALPSQRCLIFTDATTPTLVQSTTEAFTASVAVTLVNGQQELAGMFIKLTSAGPINIILKDHN